MHLRCRRKKAIHDWKRAQSHQLTPGSSLCGPQGKQPSRAPVSSLHPITPASKQVGLGRIAAQNERDPAPQFSQRHRTRKKFAPMPRPKPSRQASIRPSPFAQFGYHIGIEQKAVHKSPNSRGISHNRAKSSSPPTSGISSNIPFKSGKVASPASASSRVARKSNTSRFSGNANDSMAVSISITVLMLGKCPKSSGASTRRFGRS